MIDPRRLLFACAVAVAGLVGPASANTDLESIMWDLATSTESLDNVNAFIENFPESENIDAARDLAEKLRTRDRAASLEDSIFAMVGTVTFSAPLAFGDENILGQTLPQIMESSPAYPPVAGLPEAYWKDETCASCHQWSREALCTQATTYVTKDPSKYRDKKHPFGGLLKINLRNWAQNGCN